MTRRFLTPREVKTLTGADTPEDQVRSLDRRGIRHLGVNDLGRVIVPVAAVEGGPMPPKAWSPDYSKLAAQ